MSAAHARPGGEPSGRPWRAAKRATLRRAGRLAAQDDSDQTPSPAAAPSQSPLDFALAFMRDTSKPDALRVSVAKAALPYVHGRWCPAGSDPRNAPVGSTRLAPLHDAQPKLPPPFDLPDPYNSLRVDWRDALERAGLVQPAPPANEAMLVPGAALRETLRRRPGTVTDTVAGTVPDQQCTASQVASTRLATCIDSPQVGNIRLAVRCSASGTSAANEAPDTREAAAPRADSEERTRTLEQRATLAEGRLREAQHHARDMEQRALAAEALIAGRR